MDKILDYAAKVDVIESQIGKKINSVSKAEMSAYLGLEEEGGVDNRPLKLKMIYTSKKNPNIVIKRFPLSFFLERKKKQIKMIENELKITVELQSVKQVTKIVQYLETEEYYYLFFEKISGINLLEFMINHKEPLSWDQNIFIFRQLIVIVEEIHKKNIAHQDLKAENIIIDPQTLIVHIIDFGFSKEYPNHEFKSSDNCGSIPYMCPLKFRSHVLNQRGKTPEGDLSEGINPFASDIFALGVIFFSLIFRHFPWSFDERMQCIRESNKSPPVYFTSEESKSTPPHFKCLLLEMLNLSQEHRVKIEDLSKHPFFYQSTNKDSEANVSSIQSSSLEQSLVY